VIVVTGGAGFIGGNLVADLVARGRDVVVVDELARASAEGRLPRGICDALDKDEFVERLEAGGLDSARVEAIVHLGACTDTTERDEGYLFRNNVQYSERLLRWALARRVPFVYASSAAVYGHGPRFGEEPAHEAPLTGYGRSKWLFDQRVRAALPAASGQVVGLRYFNVYGPGEAHKGAMASIVFHLHGACRAGRPARLFGASHGWAAGEQRRDFVHVADIVAVTEWFLEHPARSGIFNVGTGTSASFNELARLVLARCGGGEGIEYVPMPAAVRDGYQSYTCADLALLRRVGYEAPFQPVASKVPEYLDQLDAAARADRAAVRAVP
jgi:ADP-L-glycero-D-manno-heptose 6-epimerase